MLGIRMVVRITKEELGTDNDSGAKTLSHYAISEHRETRRHYEILQRLIYWVRLWPLPSSKADRDVLGRPGWRPCRSKS